MKPKPSISWVWRSLLHGRELLKKKGRWSVGSRARIYIVEDHWLASEKLVIVKEGTNVTKVQDLIDPNSHCWNIDALRLNLDPGAAIDVLKAPIGWYNSDIDLLFCPQTKDGNYSTKSGYFSLMEDNVATKVLPSSSYQHFVAS